MNSEYNDMMMRLVEWVGTPQSLSEDEWCRTFLDKVKGVVESCSEPYRQGYYKYLQDNLEQTCSHGWASGCKYRSRIPSLLFGIAPEELLPQQPKKSLSQKQYNIRDFVPKKNKDGKPNDIDVVLEELQRACVGQFFEDIPSIIKAFIQEQKLMGYSGLFDALDDFIGFTPVNGKKKESMRRTFNRDIK